VWAAGVLPAPPIRGEYAELLLVLGLGRKQVAGQQRLELYDGIGMRLAVPDREVQHRVGHVHDHLGDRLPVADLGAGGERRQDARDL
jgi:hypothetical protein